MLSPLNLIMRVGCCLRYPSLSFAILPHPSPPFPLDFLLASFAPLTAAGKG